MDTGTLIILAVIGYLVGAIPTAYLVARWIRGIDIRNYGSGNSGASNLGYIVSTKIGFAVGLWDFFKGVLAVLIPYLLGMGAMEQAVCGLAIVVGHNWPIFLQFNGGRGVSTAMGVAFTLMPWALAPFIIILVPVLVMRKHTPLPVLVSFATLPMVSLALEKPDEVTLGLLALLLIIIIRRVTAPQKGTARLTNTVFMNRFLYDRDISDGNAWVKRNPDEVNGRTKKSREKAKK